MRLHFLNHFFFNFEILSAFLVANILNFLKHPQLLHFDEFEGGYGDFSKKGHFLNTLYVFNMKIKFLKYVIFYDTMYCTLTLTSA